MATIKDVARKAGVSISTVSLTFNSPERVSETTRMKIYDAARTLNYTPAYQNRQKAGLERKQKTVAVLTGNLIGPFWFEVLRGINETLNIAQYEMVLFSSDDSFEKHFLNLVRDRECLGIILVSTGEGGRNLLQKAVQMSFPVMMCDPLHHYTGIGSINVDQRYVGELAARHFISLGRKKIAVLGTCPAHCADRSRGFIETLNRHGIDVPDEWHIECVISETQACQAMEDFLQRSEVVPDAVFGINDEAAIGAIKTLQSHNISVPEDVSVIGCDNISVGRFIQPTLTTIEIPKFEVGVLAANMILRQIAGLGAENTMLNGKLIVRNSTSIKKEL